MVEDKEEESRIIKATTSTVSSFPLLVTVRTTSSMSLVGAAITGRVRLLMILRTLRSSSPSAWSITTWPATAGATVALSVQCVLHIRISPCFTYGQVGLACSVW